MAQFASAIWAPLPENETQPAITPTQFIVHTAVDHPGPSNLPAFFGRSDVHVESHFWIPTDGNPVQMMDTNVRADANLTANQTAISVETEDDGDPEGNPWTDSQIDHLIALMAEARERHGIPLEVMASPTAPGVGWHSMWGFDDPVNLVGPKDNPWTPSFGKTCPGKTRIGQLLEEVLPVFTTDDKDLVIADLQAQVAKHKATQQRLRATAQRMRADKQRLAAQVQELRTQPPPVPSIDLSAYQALQARAEAAESQIAAVREALGIAATNLEAATTT